MWEDDIFLKNNHSELLIRHDNVEVCYQEFINQN